MMCFVADNALKSVGNGVRQSIFKLSDSHSDSIRQSSKSTANPYKHKALLSDTLSDTFRRSLSDCLGVYIPRQPGQRARQKMRKGQHD